MATEAGIRTGASPAPGVMSGTDPKWWTLAAVCLGTFMLLLDITIVNVALPAIQRALHSSFADLQWVVDAYALTLAALLLTAGSLADMFGRRLLWVIGLVTFTAASVACGAAQSPLMLELSRGAQGVGGAIMFSVSLALLANTFHGRDRGVAFGVWGAVTGVAVAIGPIAGGALVSGLSWRYIFFVNLPVGVVAVVLSVTRVIESRDPHARRPDWLGFGLFTVALACLIYGLIESGSIGFGATRAIAFLAAAGVLLAAFLATEMHGEHPMFDLALFRLPTFSGGAIAAFGLSAGVWSVLLYLVLYLQDVLRFSAFQTGLRLLALSGGVLAVSWLAGRLSSKVPVRFLIGPGLALIGVALLLMRGLDAHSGWAHLIPGLVAAGIGAGFVNPPLASTAVGVVQPQQAGMASGINSTFRQVGIATGIALLGTLFSNHLTQAVTARTSGTPLSSSAGAISAGLERGNVGRLVRGVPGRQRGLLELVLRGSFTSGLDEILLVAAIISFVSAALALVLIRSKDFAPAGQRGANPGAAAH